MAESAGYKFGPFRLDLKQRDLIGGAGPVALGSRAFDLLLAFLRRPGELVSKNALMAEVWPGAIVEENNLTTQLAAVRRAIGDGRDGARYILTVPGRGYRFVAPVEPLAANGGPAAPAESLAAAPSPMAAELTKRRHNLPHEVTSFVGRDRELDDIRDLVGRCRLVTVTGPGGVGKTRILLKVAAGVRSGYPDGAWLVELAALASPDLVVETVAALFGIAAQPAGSMLEPLAAFLRDRRLLLVLDNCEHLVAATASLAAALIRSCPGVTLLASSREPLAVAGEFVYPLSPLELPPEEPDLTAVRAAGFGAVQLFVERARAATGSFVLRDETAAVVAQICRRLDGIALAIELAAPRLKMLRPQELATRLSDRFRLLTGGDRAALPRQQTLRALIDWSFNLLTRNEQVMLERLSVFAGSWTLEGAEAVAEQPPIEPGETVTLVSSLIDKSLVSVVPGAGPETRYRLLESTRDYARERLERSDDRRPFLARHMDRLFEAASASWQTAATEPWLARYEPEIDNLRAALTWAFGEGGDPELGIRLTSHTGRFWLDLSLLRESRRWFEAASAACTPETPPLARGLVLLNLAFSGFFGRRSYERLAREAVEIFRSLGRRLELARALRLLGGTLARPGDVAEAEGYVREAEMMLRALGRTKEFADLLGDLAAIRHFAGDAAGAIAIAEESLGIARALGHRRGILTQAANLAEYEFARGEVARATALAREAVETSRRGNSQRHIASLLENLAGYLIAADRTREALPALREALSIASVLGVPIEASVEHLALLLALEGEPRTAARLLGYGNAQLVRQGNQRGTTEQATYRRLDAQLTTAFAPDERARLEAAGAAWTEEEAAHHALAACRQTDESEPPERVRGAVSSLSAHDEMG